MQCNVTKMIFAYQAYLNILKVMQGNKFLQQWYFVISSDLQHAVIKYLGSDFVVWDVKKLKLLITLENKACVGEHLLTV